MLFWPVAQAAPDSLPAILAAPELKGAQVGVCVTDESGTVLFEQNADLRFVPASNQKVVTCLYAMEALGADFQPVTSIWKSNKRVIVTTQGQPFLTLKDLRQARHTLKLDKNWPVFIQSRFQPVLGPGWEWDDLPWYYAAPTSILSFDRASFEVWADNGRIESLPPELGIRVIRLSGGIAKAEFEPDSRTLTVRGSLPKQRTSLGKFAQPKPLQAVARALGGDLSSAIVELPRRAADLVWTGPKTAQVIKECLEPSDNVLAEQLLMQSSLKLISNKSVDYSSAVSTERSFLSDRTGVDSDGFRPADGSGLSRHNQISPRAMCRFLAFALSRPYRDQWIEALAASGEGTLKNRLKNSTFVGKTGTMDAVVSLSGYVTTKDGKRLIVSFLVNNTVVKASEVRTVQDKFIRALENGQTDGQRNSETRLVERALP